MRSTQLFLSIAFITTCFTATAQAFAAPTDYAPESATSPMPKLYKRPQNSWYGSENNPDPNPHSVAASDDAMSRMPTLFWRPRHQNSWYGSEKIPDQDLHPVATSDDPMSRMPKLFWRPRPQNPWYGSEKRGE